MGTELTVEAIFNREKRVASGIISGYGTDRRSDLYREKRVVRDTYSLMNYTKFKEELL